MTNHLQGFDVHRAVTIDADDQLDLHPLKPPPPRSLITEIIAKSAVVHSFFQRALDAEVATEYLKSGADGKQIACLLMQRIGKEAVARNVKLVVVAQPQFLSENPGDVGVKDHVLGCAKSAGIVVADLFPVIDAVPPNVEERALLPK